MLGRLIAAIFHVEHLHNRRSIEIDSAQASSSLQVGESAFHYVFVNRYINERLVRLTNNVVFSSFSDSCCSSLAIATARWTFFKVTQDNESL